MRTAWQARLASSLNVRLTDTQVKVRPFLTPPGARSTL